MARVIGKSKSVPVIPGPVTEVPACAACRHDGIEVRLRTVMEGIDMALCLNSVTCCARYRGGRTPAQYGADLRAVAA